ncbi:MAG: ATP-binding protein, partial [Bacteroidales bacterium]|nr:ATP-binding protein [Bacteroidales bacterium]
VVFIDELPWMDAPRSQFVSALEHFWNGFASARKDILLIICGSATSWIINNVFRNHGGLHNRVTHRIHLQPFTLRECELYAKSLHLSISRYEILECYMVLGGIPFYWSLLERGMSVSQNIDNLFFNKNGKLRNE